MLDHLSRIDFGRAICGDPDAAGVREWLATNGIGGFACGTISGELTRRYHGLLVAALTPPLGRTLLVTRIEEKVGYAGSSHDLYADHVLDGAHKPESCQYLERFHLEGTTPIWVYALEDALLEKRVWMHQGANTTYVQYRMLRGGSPITLYLKIITNDRDYHGETLHNFPVNIQAVEHGIQVRSEHGSVPVYLLSSQGHFSLCGDWTENYALAVEQYRGFSGQEIHLHAADYTAPMKPGEEVTLVLSTHQDAELDGGAAYSKRVDYEKSILHLVSKSHPKADEVVRQLALAADQFIVERMTGPNEKGRSVIAGYPWFGDWGRDTMISLPGLTLANGRAEVAASILRTFSRFVSRGMLPNRFPDQGEKPEYNTVDATLWYFEAIRLYLEAAETEDWSPEVGEALLVELYPVLEEIIDWHLQGTRFHIHADPKDHLIYAGEPGVQLTWMDAKVEGWVVTPRIGKPVEINALWYNALCCMSSFARGSGKDASTYEELAAEVQSSFSRFWCRPKGWCFDVIDGPGGDDASLRPNQIFAVALRYSPLEPSQQRAVVDACARYLLTSHGLRSLAAFEPDYQGVYEGSLRARDGAYHQGTVWSWLIGPFTRAYLRVYNDRAAARSFLLPLLHHLSDHGLGSVSEIFDGDPPHMPRGCIAQAWGVAELLRAWIETG